MRACGVAAVKASSAACSAQHAALRLCYVHCYRAPHFIRTDAQLEALRECPEIEVRVIRNRHRGAFRYVELLLELWRSRRARHPDVYLLGFRGHEIFWLLWLFARPTPIVIDALMSPSFALIEERKAGAAGRALGFALLRLERQILKKADLVLTDTTAHARWYSERFGIPPESIVAIPVGARIIDPRLDAVAAFDGTTMHVLFYGSFLPLHGIDVILEAAASVQDLPFQFDFIGGSAANMRWLRKRCATLGIRRYTHRRWVPFEDLSRHDIARTHICLGGPFGGTPQSQRVITTKTIQCIAQGKPTIIGAVSCNEGFVDRVNCLIVPQRDPTALASALRWCYGHPEQLQQIGRHASRLYGERFSAPSIAAPLSAALHQCAHRHRA